MILTYKVRHNRDFSVELEKAKKVADYAIHNRDMISTKYVSHIGLNSTISNQVLRKYSRNKKCRIVKSVKLTIPSLGTKVKDGIIRVIPLKLDLLLAKDFIKVNQVEIDDRYAYISVTVATREEIVTERHIGVDLNTTGHCAVIAVKETGKVYKLGKKANHTHLKYKNIRKRLQKASAFKVIARVKNRESRIIKDTNHKISRFLINLAVREKGGISLEKLQDIRRRTVSSKNFKYSLNSWSFYQLGKFIAYKAKLAGIPITYIDPAYTSKTCSRCGLVGNRSNKYFQCPKGHVEHADVGAAFNIALPSSSIVQLQKERVFCKRSSDTR